MWIPRVGFTLRNALALHGEKANLAKMGLPPMM